LRRTGFSLSDFDFCRISKKAHTLPFTTVQGKKPALLKVRATGTAIL
jgi:hypothetical protein